MYLATEPSKKKNNLAANIYSSDFISDLIQIGFNRLHKIDEENQSWILIDSIMGHLKILKKINGFEIEGNIPGVLKFSNEQTFSGAVNDIDQKIKHMQQIVKDVEDIMNQLIKTDDSKWPFYRVLLSPGQFCDVGFDQEDFNLTPKITISPGPHTLKNTWS